MTVTFQQTPGSSSDRATEWLRLLIERARTAQRAMTDRSSDEEKGEPLVGAALPSNADKDHEGNLAA